MLSIQIPWLQIYALCSTLKSNTEADFTVQNSPPNIQGHVTKKSQFLPSGSRENSTPAPPRISPEGFILFEQQLTEPPFFLIKPFFKHPNPQNDFPHLYVQIKIKKGISYPALSSPPKRRITFSFLTIFNQLRFITDKAKELIMLQLITNKIVPASDEDWPNCLSHLHFCRPNLLTFCANPKLTEPGDLLYLCN